MQKVIQNAEVYFSCLDRIKAVKVSAMERVYWVKIKAVRNIEIERQALNEEEIEKS